MNMDANNFNRSELAISAVLLAYAFHRYNDDIADG